MLYLVRGTIITIFDSASLEPINSTYRTNQYTYTSYHYCDDDKDNIWPDLAPYVDWVLHLDFHHFWNLVQSWIPPAIHHSRF